jgi:hypothetical protein
MKKSLESSFSKAVARLQVINRLIASISFLFLFSCFI